MNAIQQQNQALIDNLALQVQKGDATLSSIAAMMGGDSIGQRWAIAVKDRLTAWGVTANPAAAIRSIMLQDQRAQRESRIATMQELIAAGFKPYNPKQEVFTAVVRKHLDGCEDETYPSARSIATGVAGDKASNLLGKSHSKKQLSKALQENKEHPAMQLIHSVCDNSALVATVSGSVSNCLGTLANNHKVARRLERIEQEQERAQRSEKQLQARIASLEARRDLEDEGKDWRTEASRLLTAQPSMSQRALAREVGVSQTAMRKYLLSLEA